MTNQIEGDYAIEKTGLLRCSCPSLIPANRGVALLLRQSLMWSIPAHGYDGTFRRRQRRIVPRGVIASSR
jgi:hypothetical protein